MLTQDEVAKVMNRALEREELIEEMRDILRASRDAITYPDEDSARAGIYGLPIKVVHRIERVLAVLDGKGKLIV
jgi:hypothetical protein